MTTRSTHLRLVTSSEYPADTGVGTTRAARSSGLLAQAARSVLHSVAVPGVQSRDEAGAARVGGRGAPRGQEDSTLRETRRLLADLQAMRSTRPNSGYVPRVTAGMPDVQRWPACVGSSPRKDRGGGSQPPSSCGRTENVPSTFWNGGAGAPGEQPGDPRPFPCVSSEVAREAFETAQRREFLGDLRELRAVRTFGHPAAIHVTASPQSARRAMHFVRGLLTTGTEPVCPRGVAGMGRAPMMVARQTRVPGAIRVVVALRGMFAWAQNKLNEFALRVRIRL